MSRRLRCKECKTEYDDKEVWSNDGQCPNCGATAWILLE